MATVKKSRPDGSKAPAVRRRSPPPGRGLKNSNARAATLPAIERAELALLLRHEGMTWQAISDYLGYAGRGAAYAAAMRLAVLISPPSQEERDAARVDALARLDALWPLIEEKLGSHDAEERAQAMQRAVRLISSYALWMGCAATETPPAQRLRQYGLMLAPKEQERRP